MAVADDLDRARAALQMINPAPYNAEAPPTVKISPHAGGPLFTGR